MISKRFRISSSCLRRFAGALAALSCGLMFSAPGSLRAADFASLSDLVSGTGSSSPQCFVELAGKVYFTASNGASRQLFRYDSAAATGAQITQVSSFSGNTTHPSFVRVLGTKLVMAAQGSGNGYQLWEYDPAAAAGSQFTEMVTVSGVSSTDAPRNFLVEGGKLYFAATNGARSTGHGFQLYVYDPAAPKAALTAGSPNPRRLTNLATTSASGCNPANLIAAGGYVLFSANLGYQSNGGGGVDQVDNTELVAVNTSTLAVTTHDLAQGSLALTSNGSGYTDQFDSTPLVARAVVGSTAYFSAGYTASPHGSSNYRGQVLMKFDPTTMAAPAKVAELNPDSGVTIDSAFSGLITTGNFTAGDSITAMAAVGTKVYYAANSGSGAKLYVCDTASADTVAAVAGFDAPTNLAVFNSRLYCLGSFSGTSKLVEVDPASGAVTSFALATSPFSLGGYITVGSNMYFAGGADVYLFNASARTVTKQTGITGSSLTATTARQLPLGLGTAAGDFLFGATDATVGTEVFHFAAPITPAPTVTSLSATSIAAAGGTSITITGTNFTGATAVKFGSTNATSFTVDSATQITAVVPAGSAGATGNVTVTTSGGTSATGSGNAFGYAATLNGTPAYIVRDGATTAATRFAPVYSWGATTTTNAPVARDELTAVWTGATGTAATTNRLIVWGGNDGVTQKNTGGLYNPATDTWTATTTTGAPAARLRHTAVWTGNTGSATTSYRMIVFGGETPTTNTGGIYNPATDAWSATTTTSAPTARAFHTAVWTGATGNAATANRMIVWGGYDVNGAELNSGGIYDPATNTWTATATTGAPTGRVFHTAIWTGDTGSAATSHKMIVFGGESPYGTSVVSNGGIYDPATNSWTAIASSATAGVRAAHTAIWTGTEMIVFGGYNSSFAAITGGARYNPATNTWLALPGTNQPSARQNHTAIWSGDAMVVFGGIAGSTRLNTGAIYSPSTDTWAALTSTGVPAARTSHAAIWSGSQMIVFGGSGTSGSVNTGGVLSVAPNVSLGSQAAGTALSRSFNIENNGSGTLTGVTVSFTGANASDFAVTSAPASTIAAGSNSAFTISFTPAAGGARSATLQIASNDPVRAPYLINLSGTGLASSPPTLTTTAAASIAATSATLGGQVTADGGASVTERGIVYSASNTTPTTSDTKVTVGSGTGTFSQSVTGLGASTTYYFRAYATNSSGTAYGTVLNFSTLPAAPEITNATLVASGTYGSAFGGYTITASNSPTGYTATGLPTGLSINPSTGAISGTPSDTGTFNVALGAANAGGSGTATLVLTINKRTLLVTGITASGKVYDGTTAATINATNAVLTGKISGDDVTLDKTNAAGVFASKAVGTRSVAISGLSITGAQSAHYSLSSLSPSAAITAKPLTITGVTVSNKVYDGTAAATLVVSGAALAGVADTDSVSLVTSSAAAIFTSSNAGTHAVTITGFALSSGGDAANYTLTQPTASATITRATLTVTADAKTRTYGAANPAFTATLTGFVANEDATTASVTGNAALSTAAGPTSSIGTHDIVAAAGTLAAANYSFTTANGTLTITKAGLTVTADDKTRIYGAANPAFTATITGFVNGETLATSGLTGTAALSTTADASSAVATYAITAAAGDLAATNYSFTLVNGTLTVTKAPLTIAADNKSRTYGAANPAFTASFSGFVNGDTVATATTGNVALSTNANATTVVGSYDITAGVGTLAAANYTFSFTPGTLAITKATLTVTADAQSRAYGSANPTLTAAVSGFVNGDTLATATTGAPVLSTTAVPTSGQGSYPITVAAGTLGAGNYHFTLVDSTLTVTRAVLTVTADSKSRVYGGANPTLTATISGFLNGDTRASSVTGAPSLSTTATAASAVGSHAITAGAGSLAATNYTFAFAPGTLSVTPAVLTVTADNQSRVYGAADPAFTATVTGFLNGDTLASSVTGTAAVTTTATVASSVGTHPLTAAAGSLAAGNYTFTFAPGTLSITKAPLTVAADAQARTYGAANPTLTVTISGFVNGETLASSGITGSAALTTTADATSAVAVYPITPTLGTLAASNYLFTTLIDGALTVTKAPLVVAADAKSRLYGSTNPALTVTLTGFVNHETLATSGVTGAAAISTGATPTSPVSTYAINVAAGTLAAANYSFASFVDGVLTVLKAPLTVTADAASKIYGDANPAFTATLTGFVNGESLATSGVVGAAAFTTAATTASAAANYAVRPNAGTLSAANYSFATFVEGVLTVTKAPLTLTAENKSRAYGAANPALTVLISGFVNGESLATSGVTGTPALTTSAVATTPTGNYAIATAVGTLAADNYRFATFVDGTLTITAAQLTVTADNKTKVYGAGSPVLSATITGFLNGDTAATAVTGDALLSTTASAASGVGTYPIVAAAGTLAATNYSFTFAAGTLAVTPAVITVAAENKSRSYAAPNPEFTATAVGFVNGDTAATALTGTAALTTQATLTNSVGAYPITAATGSLASANYTFAFVDGTLTITPASAQVALSNGLQTYSGQPRSITVSTSPGGLAYAVNYNGSATLPTAAGTYAVTAVITDSNYTGGATGTLTIERATQAITFAAASSNPLVGIPFALSASASSGLPVAFAIVSGNATVAGASLTLNDASPVVVRATQAGSADLLAASAQQTFTAAAKRAQTIAFASLENKRVDDPAFTLSASASSGLPVSFTVVSGPAIVSGNTVTFTGTSGAVAITATQSGNAAYSAAPEVTQTFNVIGRNEHQVFFGLTTNNDTVAIDLAPDGKSGTLLCYLGSTGEAFVVSFTVNADGTFDAIVTSLGAASATLSAAAADESTPRRSAALATRTFRGRFAGGAVSGTIMELGLNFTAALQPARGPTAAIAGLYKSSALNSANGTTASIVGTQGQVLVIASTPLVSTGGAGSVDVSGRFQVEAPGAMITGVVDAPSTTVAGSVTVPNQAPINFTGLANSTLRTDRLANLSSRARIGPAAGRTLITGFVVGGSDPKRVLLRAIGPALGGFGVTGAIANPRLELYNAQGQLILANDDWSGNDTAAAFAQVGAFSLANGTRDAALLTTLAPAAYTMHVTDGGETGVALAEIYDASANPQGEYQRLVNISSRGMVEAGDAALIGGFVVTGNAPKKVLVRGVGPALAAFGVGGTLADPRLAIYSSQTLVAQNNDWSTPTPIDRTQGAATASEVAAAAQATGAFAFAAGSKDSAIVITLAPGPYTAQITSSDGTTGVALVEIYELPE